MALDRMPCALSTHTPIHDSVHRLKQTHQPPPSYLVPPPPPQTPSTLNLYTPLHRRLQPTNLALKARKIHNPPIVFRRAGVLGAARGGVGGFLVAADAGGIPAFEGEDVDAVALVEGGCALVGNGIGREGGVGNGGKGMGGREWGEGNGGKGMGGREWGEGNGGKGMGGREWGEGNGGKGMGGREWGEGNGGKGMGGREWGEGKGKRRHTAHAGTGVGFSRGAAVVAAMEAARGRRMDLVRCMVGFWILMGLWSVVWWIMMVYG
ncbi:hypothetical protein ACLMJK_007622 [Lecanora helva]